MAHGRVIAGLALVLAGAAGAPGAPPPTDRTLEDAAEVLGKVILPTGVSGKEAEAREAVRALLPSDLTPEVDRAGNLLVRLGDGPFRIVLVAHLDEIGFGVRGVEPDGRVVVERHGGFIPALFEAVPVVVHGANGPVPGVVVPRAPDATEEPKDVSMLRLDVGADTGEAATALGIRPGDVATVRKTFDRLGATRAMGRAMDDRVGCTALLLALRNVARERLAGATVTFAWVTLEEVGLRGSADLAARLAAASPDGKPADLVVAVDTFVSADTPLEDKRFGDAKLGAGCVARAADHSNLAPLDALARLRALCARRAIPLQWGQTGGGNDGAVWVSRGAIDLPLAWPLRSSHSWVEVIDLRDLVALSRAVQAVAEEWR